ncbi:bifunctional 4-hydroxy-2-oxoglutarate aldolase/2-dehydro-3-deoxy-phosphogluconate aldolase [Lysobacter sp. CFH 32150]|uniref:bifunctional 4-hydroxy-2-oxoglutarate aldolase/2-dehydro-3-deoxy-phosphogluconate aldolase n=1 Tax=Lysobacter sp. CFH 32150 TaxID=2927128 RepID=UPI00272C28CB|nr:bifunctional 4-hydroxy-2-oxoglutarate aldolase/2-dehydro-3-deoxy-phosphogluconate aldolase [Lysobacter sp. CFH 32150]
MTGMEDKQQALTRYLTLAPVVPVVVIDNAAHAVPLARALVAGGICAIEITLRTPAALDAVRAVAAEVEGAVVGVGTVLAPEHLLAAERAGARFAVSPGASADLLAAARDSALPWLPGAATASEAMTLLAHGYRYLKFFPAESSGGVAALRALAGPLPELRYCATGGIGLHNARDYLALANVIAVGGSWLTPGERVAKGDWAGITQLAREAAALRV